MMTDSVNRFLTPFLNISQRKLVDEDAAPLDPGALWILHIKTWAQITPPVVINYFDFHLIPANIS